jgi:predicted lipoprotein with Yx(FWY)xxD motif
MEITMKNKLIGLAALTLALLAGCASMPGTPAMMKDGMLVDAKGMTLYTFDRDVASSGKSACEGDCAVKWPPVMARAGDKPTGDYTIIARANGQQQWAYKGKPLYTWPEDQAPGDKYGDNYNKVWHVIK